MNTFLKKGVSVSGVVPGSPAARKGIRADDILCSVNGLDIEDILDYRYALAADRVRMTVRGADGRCRIVTLPAEQDPGLVFSSYLMDEQKRCQNNCIFCFIDQNPAGMRESIYFKDDDSRLSFLFGNYITLTNLRERDVDRLIRMRISPVRVSVHTTDLELRCWMLGNRRAGECLEILRRFADAGLELHCQLVLCPGINDGAALDRTIRDLAALGPALKSVSAVPVGLTRHRENLPLLRAFTTDEAETVIRQLDNAPVDDDGTAIFFPSDEFYLLAGQPFPLAAYYGDFCQLENGVGMAALFCEQFRACGGQSAPRRSSSGGNGAGRRLLVATGTAAAPLLQQLIGEAGAGERVTVAAIENRFYGSSVTVAGLITGQDLIANCKLQIVNCKFDAILIPHTMLRAQGDSSATRGERFLDDVTPAEVEAALGVTVEVVDADGAAFFEAIMR